MSNCSKLNPTIFLTQNKYNKGGIGLVLDKTEAWSLYTNSLRSDTRHVRGPFGFGGCEISI